MDASKGHKPSYNLDMSTDVCVGMCDVLCASFAQDLRREGAVTPFNDSCSWESRLSVYVAGCK